MHKQNREKIKADIKDIQKNSPIKCIDNKPIRMSISLEENYEHQNIISSIEYDPVENICGLTSVKFHLDAGIQMAEDRWKEPAP